MRHQIIYACGATSRRHLKNLNRERAHHSQSVAALKASGNQIVSIGSPTHGFTMEDLAAAFRAAPRARTVIFDAHGNIEDEKHYVLISKPDSDDHKKGCVWAEDIYKAIARHTAGAPVNVFMLSCGAYHGVDSGIRNLPMNSTLVTLANSDSSPGKSYFADNISSYITAPAGFNVPASADDNMGEEMLLSILCKGMAGQPNTPAVAWCGPDAFDVHDLWHNAQQNMKLYALDKKTRAMIQQRLERYLAPDVATTAINAVAFLRKNISRPEKQDKYSPLKIGFLPDYAHLQAAAMKEGLLGPICAVAYLMQRKGIAAFQLYPYHLEEPARPDVVPGINALPEAKV